MRLTKIAGTGHFLPDRVITNADLEQLVETSDDWIWERSGIRERRFVPDDVTNTDLATEASRAGTSRAMACCYRRNSSCPASGPWTYGISALDSYTAWLRRMV
jgi:hypothetical protein